MNLKYGISSNFMGGESTPEYAGRVDSDILKATVRYASNFMPTCQGGLKKFWGTWLIDKLSSGNDICRVIPISGMSEPMCLLFVNNHTFKVTKDEVVDQSLPLRTSIIMDASYTQNNATIFFAAKDVAPFKLVYDGEKFSYKEMEFKEEPFFPLSWNKLYNGAVRANGYQGDVTVTTILSSNTEYSLYLPANFGDLQYGDIVATYVERQSEGGTYFQPFAHLYQTQNGNVNTTTISLIRVRNGAETTVITGSLGNRTAKQYYNQDGVLVNGAYCLYNCVTKSQLMALFSALNPIGVDNGNLVFLTLPAGHQVDDMYYMKLETGPSGPGDYYLGYDAYDYFLGCMVEGRVTDPGHTTGAADEAGDIEENESSEFDSTDVLGMRLRFHIQSGSTCAVWAKGVAITSGQVYSSDGKYYRALASGTAGDAQPTHTEGTRSDGNINFEYMHDGFGFGTVIGVTDAHTMRVRVDGFLPIVNSTGDHWDFDHFQWSQWGYDSTYPDRVFSFSGRLGYILNTNSDGSWLQMSKSDDYYDFGTTEEGQVVDTCAINTLISGHPDNVIKWILPTERLYMGSFSGEYKVAGGDSRSNVITPTSLSITPVSAAGGAAVQPIRYKRKSLFVSSTGQLLYNLSYSYQTDDFAPADMSSIGEELLHECVSEMAIIKDKEGIVAYRTQQGNLRYFNYEDEVESLSFYRANLMGKVLSLCVSESQGKTTQFVIVKRNEEYFVEYIDTLDPSYCLAAKSEIYTGGAEYRGPEGDIVCWCPEINKYYEVQAIEDEEADETAGKQITGLPVEEVVNKRIIYGIKMPCELHLTPHSDAKVEGNVQKSVRFVIRLLNSGPFSYGSTQDYNKYYEYEQSTNNMTGDIMLPASFGYNQGQNTADGPYPNDTGVALNLKTDAPLPFNLLMVSSIYV